MITREDFERILALLEKAGYKKDYTHEVFIKLKGDKAYLMDVDFMFVDKETLVKIAKEGKKVSIAGEKFIVPSLNNLIALKLHSIKYNPKLRLTKDLPDIINLLRINNLDYKSKWFRELCLRYGTEDIYKKILDSI